MGKPMTTQTLVKQEFTLSAVNNTIHKIKQLCNTNHVKAKIKAFTHKQPVDYKKGLGYTEQATTYLVLAKLQVKNQDTFKEIESEIKQ